MKYIIEFFKGFFLVRFIPKLKCDYCHQRFDDDDLYAGETCSEGGLLICKECLNK